VLQDYYGKKQIYSKLTQRNPFFIPDNYKMPPASSISGNYDAVISDAPDATAEGWTADGTGSVVYDWRTGHFWLTWRQRRGDVIRGRNFIIARSTDGISFSIVINWTKADFGADVTSLEGSTLMIDPFTGKFKLYFCLDIAGVGWRIYKLTDVNSPTEFDPTMKTQLFTGAYKDPTVGFLGGMFVMTFENRDNLGYTGFAISEDGETWIVYDPTWIYWGDEPPDGRSIHPIMWESSGAWYFLHAKNPLDDANIQDRLWKWDPPLMGSPQNITSRIIGYVFGCGYVSNSAVYVDGKWYKYGQYGNRTTTGADLVVYVEEDYIP